VRRRQNEVSEIWHFFYFVVSSVPFFAAAGAFTKAIEWCGRASYDFVGLRRRPDFGVGSPWEIDSRDDRLRWPLFTGAWTEQQRLLEAAAEPRGEEMSRPRHEANPGRP